MSAFKLSCIGLLAAGMVNVAAAEGTPSAKATFAFDPLIALPNSSCGPSAACNDVDPSATGWTTILKAQLKMANQKDLFINASLQCGIVTDTTVKSLNGSDDSAEARGTIRVRVKLTAPDGTESVALPNSGIDAAGSTAGAGIVYCDRIQQLRAKFSGLNCFVAVAPGPVVCTTPEELELILKTLNANAFNFVGANRTPGVHTIEVQARTSVNVSTTGPDGSLGAANAFIGAGSVAIEEVRMIKGNDGTTLSF